MNNVFPIILGGVIAFGVTVALGFVLIPYLHKLKFGQTILDIGPKWHKRKQGTPTMGGIMFIIASVLAIVATVVTDRLMGGDLIGGNSIVKNAYYTRFWSGVIMALSFAFVGFVDDYIKVVKKRNLGLTSMQKTVMQLLIIFCYLISMRMTGEQSMFIPFVGNVPMGWFYWIFGIAVIYGTVNAVNFTDGIDGLCSSVTLTAAVSFIVIAFMRKNMGAGLLSSVLLGACAGFLVWNRNPAKVFMGDTGSMFLGAMVVAVAYTLECPLILLLTGIVYVIEGLSDILQIGYFKLTHGKRIFKMAPIHHHFEMSGWSENKICLVFSFVNLIGGALAAVLIYMNL